MTRHEAKLRHRTIIYGGVLIIAFTYLVLCFNGYGFSCIFERYFNIRCISCGATTALMRIARFDFVGAIKANMLFTLVIYPSVLFLVLQDYICAIMSVICKYKRVSLMDKMFQTK